MDTEPAASAQLAVSVEELRHGVVVRPQGELDHDSLGPLQEALQRMLGNGARRIVVDGSDLGFCDSTGLNLLLRARAAAEETGASLVLAAPSIPLARILEVTGADEVFHVCTTVEEAVADPAGGG